MIKLIQISFYEPYTGIYVEGTKPMFFYDEKDYENWEEKTYNAFIEKYGYGIRIKEIK